MRNLLLLLLAVATLSSCGNNRKTATARERDMYNNEYHTDRDELNNELRQRSEEMRQERELRRDAHTSRNSLDYVGTYEGTVPCADCEGIKTVVILTDNDNYRMTTQYMGKGDTNIYEYEGPYDWDNDGAVITLRGKDMVPRKFRVEENRLVMLDMEGNRITGDHADHYVLQRK